MNAEERRVAFRDLAKDLANVDVDVYKTHQQDPQEPIIGEGDCKARIALFGRDPGRDEVRHQMPFVGAGGQKVRGVIHQVLHGEPMPDFEASLEVGKYLFWANTVPYKPVGNKAWSEKTKKAFHPVMMDLLFNAWEGLDVVTLGREAFLWFGIGCSRDQRAELMSYWKDEDRFTKSFQWKVQIDDSNSKGFVIHPLPHPSPLNATWYKRFPNLLEQRLTDLQLSLDNWRL